ncbi:hypothetical protein BURKHO8Y_10103 [Burkholderia sp. 8Y]|nr:hypothetical protein BURKHO8Y_10103 [Burkholderia sp. 8Y]
MVVTVAAGGAGGTLVEHAAKSATKGRASGAGNGAARVVLVIGGSGRGGARLAARSGTFGIGACIRRVKREPRRFSRRCPRVDFDR